MTLILGRKKGMTQLFAEDGSVTGVTVVQAGPCVVTQVRSPQTDGYHAIQLGYEDVRDKSCRKPQRVHAQKVGTAPKRFLREERLTGPSDQSVGDTLTVEAFQDGDLVDVTAKTRGRGFAGTIKRHGFSRGGETHGSMSVRRPGAIGCSAYPARVIKGKRMPGHFGAKRHTTKNLEILRIDKDRGLLFIKGAVPGPKGAFVQVRTARTGVKKG